MNQVGIYVRRCDMLVGAAHELGNQNPTYQCSVSLTSWFIVEAILNTVI